RHVAFNKGEFRPDYSNGQRLLAHELAHVMQQRGASAGRATFKPDARQEREADTAADRTMNGLSAQVDIASRGGALRIQADDRKSEGGTGDSQQRSQSQAASATVNIVLRAPDDKYTNDVTDYV